MRSLIVLLGALCLATPTHAFDIMPMLINGSPVPSGTWLDVVRIRSNGGWCTATVVGPRTIVTASHCAETGSNVTFTHKGKNYTAKMTQSPKYDPGPAHNDVSMGLVTTDIVDAVPHKIGGKATVGTGLTLLGYGCTSGNGGGTGGNDGTLRIGETKIVSFSGTDMVSRMSGGAALCFGDSGGPSFVKDGANFLLLGINSKGNIQDTNWNMRLDLTDAIDFMKSWASSNSATVCGINSECGGGTQPVDPSCTLTASPNTIKLGGTVTLTLAAVNATSATIDGEVANVPTFDKSIKPTSIGSKTSTAEVKNGTKSATCSANFTVNSADPDPFVPTCTLTAVPGTQTVGKPVEIKLQSTQQVTEATINGSPVSFPAGSISVTKMAAGQYSAQGFVKGPGGSSNCYTDYKYEEGTTPPPPVGDFAVTPTHCGDNYYPESGVKSACMAIVTKDASFTDFKAAQVILVNFTNGTQEVLPILGRKPIAGGMTGQNKEELTYYTLATVKGLSYPVAANRTAKLTKLNSGDVPVALEGYTSTLTKNSLFLVKNLSAFGASQQVSNLPISLH